MKLTAEVLIEKLRERFQVTAYGNITGRPAFGCPLLYEKGRDIHPGHFYVAEERTLKEADFYGENICFVFACRPSEECFVEELSYIRIETEQSILQVMNEVQEIFSSFEGWKEELEKIRNEGGQVQDYLRVSVPVLGNPLVAVGTDFTLKAQSGLENISDEAGAFEAGRLNMEYVNMLKQDALYNEMQDAREVCLYPEYTIGYRSYNLNLWEKDRCRYRLVLLEYEKKLTEGDRYLLECLAPYVGYGIYHEEKLAQGKGSTIGTVFERILTDRTADYMEISRQLTAFGWENEAKYLCMVFQTTYLDRKNFTSSAICAYLESTYSGVCSFPYKDDIVTFFNLTLMDIEVDELEGKLKYFIRESFLKAGYSWVMEGHGNLRRQYVQACIALDVGSRVKPYLWIHHFSDIAFSYILEQSARRLPGYMICHEKLLELQKIDEQQNTEYMKTLKVYLDEHLNAMQSAKKLFIHRSTFLYRLDKIKAVLESELDDPEEILYLSFSFRLLDKEKRKKD